MPDIITKGDEKAPPPKIIERSKEVVRMGFPSWAKVLVRGYIAVGIIYMFTILGWMDIVVEFLDLDVMSFSIFLISCIAIAMLFSISYLFITGSKKTKGFKDAGIPAMVIVLMKVIITIGIIYLAELFNIIPDFAREFTVSIFAFFWSIFITLNYIYHTFRRIQ